MATILQFRVPGDKLKRDMTRAPVMTEGRLAEIIVFPRMTLEHLRQIAASMRVGRDAPAVPRAAG